VKSPLDAQISGGGGRAVRPFRLVAVLGASGSGKSSLVADLVDVTLRSGRDVRVLDPAGNWPDIGEWPEVKDDPRGPEEIAEAWIRDVLRSRPRGSESLRPTLLVLEDCDTYLEGSKPRGVWRRLFTTYRHYRFDIVCVARRTQDVPKVVFTSASNVYLFRHFVSTDYIREHYGAAAKSAIPAENEPFKYALFDVESRQIVKGATRKRSVKTVSDG
jgi:hypothetical protein